MVNNWATSIFALLKLGFQAIFWFSVISLCFFCFQLFANFLKLAFFKKRVQKLGFSIFSVLSLNFENYLFLGLLKHYKNRAFSNFGFCCWKRRKRPKKTITEIYEFLLSYDGASCKLTFLPWAHKARWVKLSSSTPPWGEAVTSFPPQGEHCKVWSSKLPSSLSQS